MTVTLEEIRSLIADQLGLASVGENDHLIEDLGAESADLVNIATALEAKYGVYIDDSEIEELKTVGDVYSRMRRAV